MVNANHIQALRERHAALDRQIEDLQKHPGSEDIDIKKLKFDKLRVKDELARLVQH